MGWGVMFKPEAGPLLRTCKGKGRGSFCKGGPSDCGAPEFGGGALGGGVGAGLVF